ncbi:HlyD family type I secretion periplasmic adaptor subunit [Bradyrhizobium sp.]|uniref:HlyD family type I secretion periplasmic adaptor subunit n=1 Tax=Bradyrhizobium sp. TaxID=376 RepID=UPI0025C73E3B|nr:HlyD family type I secretion periplasmic adaptor subunit [Bradyrhizobium sp.]MBV8917421.1 HlyD family type I secretion periplasmic adaptor subunit [Bradyrhizobium sp.]
MQKPASRVRRANDQTVAAILEFQSPAQAIVATPIPHTARSTIWVISSMFAAGLAAMGLIPIDRVVTAQGKVVSKVPLLVVQPLETSVVQSIDVTEGQSVRSGEVVARLDPTFATADAGALEAQVSMLQAEVVRMQAEAAGHPFTFTDSDPSLSLQASIYAQRQSERDFKRETYQQRINGLQAAVARALADADAYRARKAVAEQIVSVRKELERHQVGSTLLSLSATDNLLETERGLANATETVEGARRDLEALKAEREAYEQNWLAEVSQKLSEQTQKLADAREQLNKARLRRQLVELRANLDATVLTVAKVSIGSVLQSGDQFITLVPTNAPLEVEANIPGHDGGFVQAGASVAIKFDTFPFSQYGLAHGKVRTISADSFTGQDDAKTRSSSAPARPDGSEPFYRSRITIDNVQLHNVPAGFRVVPGMPVTTDIMVGKRTVLTYLLGRILPVTSEAMREP